MRRYIDITDIEIPSEENNYDELVEFADAIAEQEIIQLPERKKGKWIDYSEDGFVECPFCHSATNCEGNKDELHYCFCCGADMRGEQDE